MIAAFLNKLKEIEIKNVEIPEPKVGEGIHIVPSIIYDQRPQTLKQ